MDRIKKASIKSLKMENIKNQKKQIGEVKENKMSDYITRKDVDYFKSSKCDDLYEQ